VVDRQQTFDHLLSVGMLKMSAQRAVAPSRLTGGMPTSDINVVIDQAIAAKEAEFGTQHLTAFVEIERTNPMRVRWPELRNTLCR
jgi:hypothetical protein